MLLNERTALSTGATNIPMASLDDATVAGYASMIMEVRKQLTAELPPAYLYDPVFDVLLSLCGCVAQQRSLTGDELCKCSSAAPNSTRRWLRALEDMKLVHECAGRYRLTRNGRDLMTRTFTCLAPHAQADEGLVADLPSATRAHPDHA
jgi:hypothetical protein